MLCRLKAIVAISLLLIAPGIAQETGDQEENLKCPSCINRKGMTWGQNEVPGFPYLVRAACYGDPPGPCDAYNGDTHCSNTLPILCIHDAGLPRPNYDVTNPGYAMPPAFYRGWSGGYLAQTYPVQGYLLTPAYADKLCSILNGPGFRMAEHHDGKWVNGMDSSNYYGKSWPAVTQTGGWSVTGYGYLCKDTRFWTRIKNQLANCWDP